MDGLNEHTEHAEPPRARRRRPNNSEMNDLLTVAKQITELFKLERYVYISCCGVAVILLLLNAAMLIYEKKADTPGLVLLFGSGGLITYSMGRLIYMWNKIIDKVLGASAEEGEEDEGN